MAGTCHRVSEAGTQVLQVDYPNTLGLLCRMPRTAVGTRPQPDCRTALYAYFAARLAGIPARSFDEYFEALGLLVRQDGVARAVRGLKYEPSTRLRAGRHTSARVGTVRPEQAAFREWLLIHELRLDLEVAVVRFPGNGARQGDLIRALTDLPGVRHIIETAGVRDVLAIVVFSGPRERRDLQACLEEIAPRREWDDVLFETQEPTVRMWEALARRAAEAEDLLASA